MKTIEALNILVEAGADVKLGGYMFYKTQGGKYRILSFDNKSRLKSDEEQNFDNFEVAAKEWVNLVGDKLT